MIKKDYRAQLLQQLKKQDKKRKAVRDRRLLHRFIHLEAYQTAKTIATYLAFPFEYDTALLIEQALKDGKKVLIPKTYPKGKMIFVAYDADDLESSHFGLQEPRSDKAIAPEAIDLIHVPGLAFNDQGYRIGFGAGYYDRYLADFKGATVSSIYAFQKQDFKPEPFDIPVKEVLIDDDH